MNAKLQKRKITPNLIQEMVILGNILLNLLIVGRDPQRILQSKKPQNLFCPKRIKSRGVKRFFSPYPPHIGQFIEYGVRQILLDNPFQFGIIPLSL